MNMVLINLNLKEGFIYLNNLDQPQKKKQRNHKIYLANKAYNSMKVIKF